jgi:hypothetical protein
MGTSHKADQQAESQNTLHKDEYSVIFNLQRAGGYG